MMFPFRKFYLHVDEIGSVPITVKFPFHTCKRSINMLGMSY